jgi:phosphoglycerate kinase
MSKKTIRDLPGDLGGKKILVRCDLNVAIDEKTGEIRNDRRIRASLPTLSDLLGRNASLIVMSHLGRPKPGADAAKNAPFSMKNVSKRLGEYLKRPVVQATDVGGPDARDKASALKPGEIMLLENVRFHPFEQPLKEGTDEQKAAHKEGMKKLAGDLASLGDIYVNDAFGSLQNKDVSVLGLPKAMAGKPRVMGLLVEKELNIIDRILAHFERPMIGIMGGAKVSDKIKFIEVLLKKVDELLIGGKMTYTFLKARGDSIGAMTVDPKDLELVARLLPQVGKKIVLPLDSIAIGQDPGSTIRDIAGPLPEGLSGADIGPKTVDLYRRKIAGAKTVIWNGPVGWFERMPFDRGSRGIAMALAELTAKGGTTVVGGGETAEAVEEFGLADKLTHVSTGGGAFLKYVEERRFDTLDLLDDR